MLQMPHQRVVLTSIQHAPGENSAFTELMMVCVACCGVTTVKMTPFDVPPPGAGLVTVTLKVPAVAMSEATMAAVSCVTLTNVVARALPLKLTVEPLTKFVPFTVKVKVGPPAMALAGEMLVIVGGGKQDLGGNTASDGIPKVPVEKGEPGTGLRAQLLSMLKPNIFGPAAP